MPTNKFQKIIYALITVVITVNCFVFYNVFFIEGKSYAQYGAKTIISFILVEFICAITCELLIGSPQSLKIALKLADPQKVSPFMFETIIISCTVLIMCPLMSFIAVFIYNGFAAYIFSPNTFDISRFFIDFIPNWAAKVFVNFPFAIFSQLFFIQPVVRKIFKLCVLRQPKEKAKNIVATPVE